jgi:inner membrane protein
MPSTIGHALAGAAVAWTGEALAGGSPRSAQTSRLTLAAIAIAAAPDLDLLVGVHRTFTHSIAATAIVGLAAAAIAARGRAPILRVVLVCALAHASHILLDWLAIDNFPPRGVQALWPFSRDFYISGLGLFQQTQRRAFFGLEAIRVNALAVVQELIILAPVAYLAWCARQHVATAYHEGTKVEKITKNI